MLYFSTITTFLKKKIIKINVYSELQNMKTLLFIIITFKKLKPTLLFIIIN